MAIFRTVKNKNYSTIHNGFLVDKRLSLKGKGLLSYFLSRPDDWSFYTNEIVTNCKDGTGSVSSTILELENLGYIKRKRKRDKGGKYTGGFEYFVYEIPCENNEEPKMDIPNMEKPNVEKPNMENPHMEKPNMENKKLLSTEDKLSTEYIQNTEAKESTKYKLSTKTPPTPKEEGGGSEEIYTLFNEGGFGKVNKVIKSIIDKNIEKYSKEEVKKALLEAIKNNKCKLSYVEGILRKGEKRIGECGRSYEEELREDGILGLFDEM